MKVNNQQLKNVLFTVLIILMNGFTGSAQRDLTPGKRSDAFGVIDRRNLRSWGPQITFGPTYMLTRLHNETVRTQSSSGRPVDYVIDPSGRIGGFLEIGTAHFPTKDSRIKFIKKRIVSYYDWGIGFKYLGGKETTDITNYDPTGTQILSTQHGEGKYYNGYVFGRFSAHKNFYFKEKYFIDNGIGINFDYRVLTGNQNYSGTSSAGISGTPLYYHKPFVLQLNYSLGLGIKIKRGFYIIPGIQLPIFGIAEMHKGSPALKWYASNYWPISGQVKFIVLLEKKKTSGCNEGSEEDRKRNKEYMQGQ